MNNRAGANKVCIFCGKSFYVQRSLLKKRKYCSRKCKHRAQVKVQKVQCDSCGEELLRIPSKLRENKHNYCSLVCRDKMNYKGGIKESRRRYYHRNKNNPHFKLRYTVSWLVRNRLKKRLLSKKGVPTFDILPYTIDDLIKNLESKFESWMSWDNYGFNRGEWNIDHIIPDSKFNYSSVDDDEFESCWSLDNLRPLEALDNYRKKDKIL